MWRGPYVRRTMCQSTPVSPPLYEFSLRIVHVAAALQRLNNECGLEGSPCTEQPPAFVNMPTSPSSVSNTNITGTKSRGCRCSTCWQVGKPTAARTWPSCWESIAIRSAAGWPSRPREGYKPYWRPMSRPANPSPWRPRSSPVLREPSAVQRASLRMRHCANGCGGPTAWRSNTKPFIRSCGRASAPRSKCCTLTTQKKPEAIPVFQATCHEHLQQAIPATNTHPVRVFSQDESRFGILTVR
jgi:hypothetical protein